MNRIIYVLALSVSVGVTQPGFAQRRASVYRPATPAVSPYLNLLRTSEGGLPSYYAFVRPFQQQQTTNQQQTQLLLRQEREIQQLRDQRIIIGETRQEFVQGTAPTGTGSGFMTTGRDSGFLNYSHFYPLRRQSVRRR
jgi:hypothetical protein